MGKGNVRVVDGGLRWQGRWVFETAVRYAANGWPVVPVAVARHGRCPCELGDCVEPHPVGRAMLNALVAAGTWSAAPWDVGLVTDGFDVVDVPAECGAVLHQLLKERCPTALVPGRRRWWFFLEPGAVGVDQVRAAGGVLHAGPDTWVLAPGTRTEADGRTRWLVPPHRTDWRPYRRQGPLSLLF